LGKVEVAAVAAAAHRNETIEQATFWLLVAGLAWAPLWYGGNDLIAWGINAILFPGLAALYEASLLIRGQGHPIGVRYVAVPAAFFAGAVLWIGVQTVAWGNGPFVHPVWGMAAEALGAPVAGSISVNRDLTMLALVRLITAASVFWIALQLCRNAARARHLIASIAAIACLYAAYGFVVFTLDAGRVPWLEIPSAGGTLTATFVNHNSFATYAGIGLVAVCGLVLREYRHRISGGLRGLRIAALIETTGRTGGALLAGAFLLLVALLLTGSRGGVFATAFGLFVLGGLTLMRSEKRGAKQTAAVVFGFVLVGATVVAFGEVFIGSVAERGVQDSNRLAVYAITLRSILDVPLSGFGYGTFADVFPMYRDRSIAVQGAWEQAHDTYLEVFQGLGLVFGSMLVASVALLVLRCVKGAIARRENTTVPRVAAGAAFLVGVHALVDFSLQIQAVALTFVAILGAGVAQSESSRLALED
jgi:O-antigen ligase